MFTVHLAKERFKFAACHFTLFSQTRAEHLHGHNYQVEATLQFRSIDPNTGLVAELSELKKIIDDLVEQLDEKVLLPEKSPFVSIVKGKDNIELQFNRKFYSFPKEDCLLLPLVNISSECLAQWLYQQMLSPMQKLGISHLSVLVKESAGQAVSFEA